MRYTILELTEIPRERDRLKAVLGKARYEMRKSRIIRYTSYAIILLGIVILLMGASAHTPVAAHHIYIPLIVR
jgi:hypothetical protein